MIEKEEKSVKHECVSKEQKEAPLTPHTSQERTIQAWLKIYFHHINDAMNTYKWSEISIRQDTSMAGLLYTVG